MEERRPLTLFFGGMKHCGKTTHGAKFAKNKKYDFIDIDEEIQRLYLIQKGKARNCREIYKKEGKEYFYWIEYEALLNYLENSSTKKNVQIVSLGGGICSNKNAIPILKKNGYFIYLYQDEEILFERLKKKGLPPYLGILNPRKKFHTIFQQRTSIYQQLADIIINPPDTSKDEAQQIIAKELEEFIKHIQKKKIGKR